MRLLVTGGLGFIGSNFIRLVLAERPDWSVVNLDAQTYAGNPANLADVEQHPRYRMIRGDIASADDVAGALVPGADAVVNLAAESHVDRSLLSAAPFIRTNVHGTLVLLEAVRGRKGCRFVQVSTDEVYGSLEPGAAPFDEASPLRPSSPYAASKAGGDLVAQSYARSHGLDVVITRCTNNYGPYQYPEKLIPLMITNALDGGRLPVYGDGRQRRDWLHVEDHCRGLLAALERGRTGEIYNFSAGDEQENLAMVERILALTGADASLVDHVADRPGHDRRYALDSRRAAAELGWSPRRTLDEALGATVAWYREHRAWWEALKNGSYRAFHRAWYEERSA